MSTADKWLLPPMDITPPVKVRLITHPPCEASAGFGPASGGRAQASVLVPVACYVAEAEAVDANGTLVYRFPGGCMLNAGDSFMISLGPEDLE